MADAGPAVAAMSAATVRATRPIRRDMSRRYAVLPARATIVTSFGSVPLYVAGGREMASTPYLFVYFAGPTTVADAARQLSERGMYVVADDDGCTVQWGRDSGPALYIGLNTEPWVATEASELAHSKNIPAIAGLDRRFEVPFDDAGHLEEVLNDYNTLFEVQTALQDLTGGYIWMSWNDNVIAPES